MDSFFTDRPIYKGTAPGRMDVMGGIADYCGSLLLQMPIRETTTVSVCKRKDHTLRIATNFNGDTEICSLQLPLHHLSFEEMQQEILSQPGGAWAIYVAGCILLLQKEKNIPVSGFDIMILSNVPAGKGVSSSAALEVATMIALSKAFSLKFHELELPRLAQKVENYIVGAPCGLMDQLAAYLGKKNELLPIICQPAKVFTPVKWPAQLRVCGIDSSVRHAVSGASYTDVRTAAFMGYSIIAHLENITQEELQQARESHHWNVLPYKGYLANIPVSVFEQKYAPHLPESISGKEFLEKFGNIIDGVTTVNENKIYQVKNCTQHPVYENNRVQHFYQLLQSVPSHPGLQQRTYALLGELMQQSHASYSRVGLGNERTEEIVNMVRNTGISSGVYGAKITGGGSGGTVCILYSGKKGSQTVKKIYQEFKEKYGEVIFFQGSSDGGFYRK